MTAILVAATGGHLAQLAQLESRIAGLDADRLWITFDGPQSRSLLRDRPVTFIPSIEERDVKGVLRGALFANRLFRTRDVSAVISTGSGVALSFLPVAAARGIPAHYIESAARVGPPSLTGRLLQHLPGVRLYRQYPRSVGRGWHYAGSVFDGFEALVDSPPPIRRLVVTLGSGVHGFRRLLDRLIRILPSDVEVLWQTGSTKVEGLQVDARPLVGAAELDRAIAEADAVIGHAGCGYALSALNAGKMPIIVPREKKHGELVDDHQVELARFLGERELAIYRTPETISFDDVVAAARRRVVRLSNPPAMQLIEAAR
jgi:UDP-N-acetylglucosamine transferase subunit ALG13